MRYQDARTTQGHPAAAGKELCGVDPRLTQIRKALETNAPPSHPPFPPTIVINRISGQYSQRAPCPALSSQHNTCARARARTHTHTRTHTHSHSLTHTHSQHTYPYTRAHPRPQTAALTRPSPRASHLRPCFASHSGSWMSIGFFCCCCCCGAGKRFLSGVEGDGGPALPQNLACM